MGEGVLSTVYACVIRGYNVTFEQRTDRELIEGKSLRVAVCLAYSRNSSKVGGTEAKSGRQRIARQKVRELVESWKVVELTAQ